MACGRPIVSTSIRDVVEPHGHVVRVADTPAGFVSDIEMLLARTQQEREAHEREMAAIVARTSWDATANEMAELIAQADELVPELAVDDAPAVAMPLVSRSESGARAAATAG
jgi:hypothetical protein